MNTLDRNGLELLVIAALYHGEISEGRAYDILQISRDEIREKLDEFQPNFCKLDTEQDLIEARDEISKLKSALLECRNESDDTEIHILVDALVPMRELGGE